MGQRDVWVDDSRHLLHIGKRAFPCDRHVEAITVWQDQVLLLSSDTDCLSLWDAEGLVRTARVGVYPQDMAVQENKAYICGGADGKLHLLSLPELHSVAAYDLPGMPERVCVRNNTAYVLTLLPEPEVHTSLLTINLADAAYLETLRLPGIPGGIATDDDGLWIGVSELVMHLHHGTDAPDVVVEGIGLARRIQLMADGIIVEDTLDGRKYHLCIRKERPSCDERPCV